MIFESLIYNLFFFLKKIRGNVRKGFKFFSLSSFTFHPGIERLKKKKRKKKDSTVFLKKKKEWIHYFRLQGSVFRTRKRAAFSPLVALNFPGQEGNKKQRNRGRDLFQFESHFFDLPSFFPFSFFFSPLFFASAKCSCTYVYISYTRAELCTHLRHRQAAAAI